jgi:hypothetical protein
MRGWEVYRWDPKIETARFMTEEGVVLHERPSPCPVPADVRGSYYANLRVWLRAENPGVVL